MKSRSSQGGAANVARPTRIPPVGLADRRRRDLLDAAFALVEEKGLEGLRTRDVAARARVNIATLHYYFATKEDLIVGLVDLVRQKFTERPPRAHGALDPPADTLRAHLQAAWASFNEDPRLAVVLQELVARSHRDPVARGAFRKLHDYWNAMVAGLIRAEVAAGTIRDDVDAASAARVVTSYIMGARLQLGVHPRAFDPAVVDAELENWLAPRVARKRAPLPKRTKPIKRA